MFNDHKSFNANVLEWFPDIFNDEILDKTIFKIHE